MEEVDSGIIKVRPASDDIVSLASSTTEPVFVEGKQLLCAGRFPVWIVFTNVRSCGQCIFACTFLRGRLAPREIQHP